MRPKKLIVEPCVVSQKAKPSPLDLVPECVVATVKPTGIQSLQDVARILKNPSEFDWTMQSAAVVWHSLLKGAAPEIQMAVLPRWVGVLCNTHLKDAFAQEFKVNEWLSWGYSLELVEKICSIAEIDVGKVSIIQSPGQFLGAALEQKECFLNGSWNKEAGWKGWPEEWRSVLYNDPDVWEWLWANHIPHGDHHYGILAWDNLAMSDWLSKFFWEGRPCPRPNFLVEVLENKSIPWPESLEKLRSDNSMVRLNALKSIEGAEIGLLLLNKELDHENGVDIHQLLHCWMNKAVNKASGPGLFIASSLVEDFLSSSMNLSAFKMGLSWIQWAGLSETKHQQASIFLSAIYAIGLKKVLTHWEGLRDQKIDEWIASGQDLGVLSRWLDWFGLTKWESRDFGLYNIEKTHPRQDRRLVLDDMLPVIREWQAWSKSMKIKLHLDQAWVEDFDEEVPVPKKRRL